ncbi:MAG TPA: hypothetical protein VLC46_20340 [Thermoanaerobaculia bacterium]|jgi:hypothetical protein|nr:hypothetical protein [Thermoanaerobaculia bacterium]
MIKRVMALGFLTAAAASFAFAAAPQPTWEKEPAEVRGVPFGASEALVKKTLRIGCVSIGEDRECVQRFKIGDIRVVGGFDVTDDRMHTVTFLFDSPNFEAMKAVLIEKYGPPTEQHSEPFQTKSGATYDNTVLTWVGVEVRVDARKFGSSLDSSRVEFNTSEWLRKLADRDAMKAKKAATDF